MSKAFGGVPKLAEQAELNVNTLYRTLSPKDNPELKSRRALLRAMGMQLTVRPLRKRAAPIARKLYLRAASIIFLERAFQ